MPDRERHAPTRVLIADDHRVVRDGIFAYLDGVGDIEVVGEARDGRQVLDRIAVLKAGGSPPRVVLMDLAMPRLDGIAATREISGRWPDVRVVALTSAGDVASVRASLRAGVAGFLLKDTGPDEIALAIRAVADDQMYLDPRVSRLLAAAAHAPHRPGDDLTNREREVLALVADGLSNRQIAEALVVSERTARTHVSAILAKLGVAALWAVGATAPPAAAAEAWSSSPVPGGPR
jgi:DNA-binding NarL/FixJ family response regulator